MLDLSWGKELSTILLQDELSRVIYLIKSTVWKFSSCWNLERVECYRKIYMPEFRKPKYLILLCISIEAFQDWGSWLIQLDFSWTGFKDMRIRVFLEGKTAEIEVLQKMFQNQWVLIWDLIQWRNSMAKSKGYYLDISVHYSLGVQIVNCWQSLCQIELHKLY